MSPDPGTLNVLAPAKINLALHITGQRSDGYHLIDTLVTFADFGDRLEFEPNDDLNLVISGSETSGLQSDAGNLVLRAANQLRNHVRRPELGATIHLHKYLPVAAGIGGGSADAAATLRGLNKLWALNLDLNTLQHIALPLGADIPMCLAGVTSRATGIGEIIEPMSADTLALVLINPRVAVSTPEIFKSVVQKINPKLEDPSQFLKSPTDSLAGYLSRQRNDLQTPALQIAPVIGDCLAWLEHQKNCHLARMSGSGATCFGLFETPEEAAQAAKDIRQHKPDWWAKAVATIG